jgi:soluble lytic murein transglycosylase
MDPAATALPPPFHPNVKLPPPVDTLVLLGLTAEAEEYAGPRENAVEATGLGTTEKTCALYTDIGRAKRLHRLGGQIPTTLLATAPSVANAWAWDCAFPHPFEAFVEDLENQNGLPHGLLYAVARVESGFDPDAISPARAVGMMQLLPETAKDVCAAHGVEFDEARLTDPIYSLRLGAFYLGDLLKRFERLEADPTTRVLFTIGAYNGGPEAIERWSTRMKDAPLDVWIELIPYTETRLYTLKVFGNLLRYQYRLGGEAAIATPMLARGG